MRHQGPVPIVPTERFQVFSSDLIQSLLCLNIQFVNGERDVSTLLMTKIKKKDASLSEDHSNLSHEWKLKRCVLDPWNGFSEEFSLKFDLTKRKKDFF